MPLIGKNDLQILLQKEITWERLDEEFRYQNEY
jgi:hypothetical protein